MKLKSFGYMAVGAVSASILWHAYSGAFAASNADTYKQLNLFGDVFDRVRSDYVEPPDEEKLIEAAINGLLNSLDPHSSYMNAKRFQEMQVQTRGEFGGLGIEVTMENGVVKVVAPIDDTPAARGGIMANDLITEIDGEPAAVALALPNLNELIADMKGKLGPLGLPKLVWRLKVVGPHSARLIILGIRKKFRNHRKYAALSAYLYSKMNAAGKRLGIQSGELSWTLEDNAPVNTGIKLMGGRVYKKYRVYEREIAPS